jgi:hypothetical protein
MAALKIFISYAHSDEVFKDELVTMPLSSGPLSAICSAMAMES